MRLRMLGAGFVLAALIAGLSASSPLLAQERQKVREEQPEDYPDGPNRTDTFYFCTGCHGFKVVASQGLSRERWSETFDFMVTRHKMIDPPQELRDRMLDYLADVFPERKAPGGWKNPFQ